MFKECSDFLSVVICSKQHDTFFIVISVFGKLNAGSRI